MAELSPPAEIVEQARRVLKVAQERGVDRVLALHEADLLWFPEREHRTRVDCLQRAAQFLQETSLDRLAGRGKAPATAADTKALIVSVLRELAAT